MGSTRPDTITTLLAAAARDVQRAARGTDPAHTPGLTALRDTGWQLIQLTGALADLAALLADHTGHHAADPERVREIDGGPAAQHLGHACRELAALRQTLDAAQFAARDYYTAISHLAPTGDPDPTGHPR
jgi:hypothetical protein